MADRITITPEELKAASSTFTTKAGDIRTILEALAKEIQNLENTWAGASQSTFFQTYEEMKQTLNQFPEVLDGISAQLKGVAETLEQTDEELSNSLKG